eukprot:9536764-Alexandrium_andersonii.AAC.1
MASDAESDGCDGLSIFQSPKGIGGIGSDAEESEDSGEHSPCAEALDFGTFGKRARHRSGAEKRRKKRKTSRGGDDTAPTSASTGTPCTEAAQLPRKTKTCAVCGAKSTDPDPVSQRAVDRGSNDGPVKFMRWEKPDMRGSACYYCARTHERRYGDIARKDLKLKLQTKPEGDDPDPMEVFLTAREKAIEILS